MLLGLFAVADTMVLALLGEKWMICVPYLRIMCIAYSFWPIHITNLQAINAVGRSDIFLKLEVIKKSIGIMGLVIGAMYSPVTVSYTHLDLYKRQSVILVELEAGS